MAVMLGPLLCYVLLLASNVVLTNATPVQYCKTQSDVNFCMAMESFPNATSSTTDAYITFTTTRATTGGDLGWTAVGIGEQMDSALMFIMYGDPQSKSGPTLSIRTAIGHNIPQTLEQTDNQLVFPDVRVVASEYISVKDSPRNTLSAHIICYSCDQWTQREESQPFQPWIWALNTKQDFEGNFDVDVPLKMHNSNVGMGIFWANVEASLASDQAITGVPAITSTKSNVNTQETIPTSGTTPVSTPTNSSFRSRMWGIHGFLLAVSILILHPLGIMAMRGGIPQAFKYHWWLQVAATTTSLVGILIGIILSRAYHIWHQWIGFLILACLLVQPVLGWQHHMIYLRTRSKTILSPYHIWLGHATQMLGWLNLMLGMAKKHWSYTWIMLTMALIMVEMGAVFFSPTLMQFTKQYKALGSVFDRSRRPSNGQAQAWEEYLDMSDQGDDEEDDAAGGELEAYSSEAHGAMPGTGLMSGIPKEGLDEAVDQRTWLPADKR